MKKPKDQKKIDKSRIFTPLKKVYERFLKIRGDPHEIAMGLALGLFLGMSPTMGIQTPAAILLAALFKWNKISAAIGVWITNPLTAPFVYGLNYYIGAKLLSIRKAQIPIKDLGISNIDNESKWRFNVVRNHSMAKDGQKQSSFSPTLGKSSHVLSRFGILLFE